jgi:hypothetical protein
VHYTCIEEARHAVSVSKGYALIGFSYYDRLNIVAERGAACPWLVRDTAVSLHTQFRAFPQQRHDQHLPPPSPMDHICPTVAQYFVLSPLLFSYNRHGAHYLEERVARVLWAR